MMFNFLYQRRTYMPEPVGYRKSLPNHRFLANY